MNTTNQHPSQFDADARGLAAASLVLHSMRSRDELMMSATQMVAEMIEADGCSVVLRDLENGDLVFYVVTGEKSSELRSFRLADGEGITGDCVRTASSAVVNNVRSDPRFSPRADDISGFTTRSILCVPLILEGECIGACTVVNSRRQEGFTDRDRVFCEVVAGHMAVAIRNVQLSRAAVEAARLAALGQAVAGVAHCMKNMVLVLRGGVHIVKTEFERAPAGQPSRGVQLLEASVRRLADLVEEMLTYAKDGTPAYTRADLGEIVRSAVGSLQPAAEDSGVLLLADVDADIGVVELDNAGIFRCVLNLVSNAIDACESRGAEVRVVARPAGQRETSIEVTDQGCGMDSKTLLSLYQPFFTTKGAKGTGLGLSVTRKIIEEHGGRIEVDSKTGVGSTFRIFLPNQRPAPDRLQF